MPGTKQLSTSMPYTEDIAKHSSMHSSFVVSPSVEVSVFEHMLSQFCLKVDVQQVVASEPSSYTPFMHSEKHPSPVLIFEQRSVHASPYVPYGQKPDD